MTVGPPRLALRRVALTVALTALPSLAGAQPGALDSTFGSGGRVTTAFSGRDRGVAVAVQSDGRIVVAGESLSSVAETSGDIAVARYLSDGSLDPAFGVNGKVLTDIDGFRDGATAVVLDGIGRVVVAGFSFADAQFARRMVVVRYLSNGTLDTAFGNGGKVVVAQARRYVFGAPTCLVETQAVAGAAGLVIQPDGRIVVGADLNDGFSYWLGVVRLESSGARDATFGLPPSGCLALDEGVAMVQQLSEQAFGVAVQPDGFIVVAGNRNGYEQVVLARLLPNGAGLDVGFGTSGFATAVPPSSVIEEYGRALTLQPDGKIVVAGAVMIANVGTTFREAVHVARYLADGAPDPGFGTAGRALTARVHLGMRADGLVIDSAGRIVVAGCVESGGASFGQCRYSGPATATNMMLARYSASGVLDTTFGDPYTGIDFAGHWDGSSGIALQSDGRLIAAGGASVNGASPGRFAAIRVLGGSVSCSAALDSTSRSTGRAPGSGTVTVTIPAGCPWTAVSTVPWMVVSAGSPGSGNGTITYVFAENATTTSRVGSLSIAGQSFVLTQGPATPPAFTMQPANQTVASGAQATFEALASGDPVPAYRWQLSPDGIGWSDVVAVAPYYGVSVRTLTVVPVTTTHDDFRFRVIASSSAGSVISHAARLTVTTSPACSYSVNPTELVVPAAGILGTVDLVTGTACGWNAVVSAPWLSVTPASGSGARRIEYSVAASTLAVERTAQITIGGRVVTVRQVAASVSGGTPVLEPGVVHRPNLTLTWTPPSTGPAPTAYTVVASLAPGGPLVAQLPVGTQTSLTVAAPDGTFYIRVVAVVNGAPVSSNEIRVDIAPPALPVAPQALAAVVAGSVITFTWQPPPGSLVAGYVLEAGTGPALTNLATLPLGNATSFSSPPVPNGNYYVRVRARNATGTGPASNEVRAVVGPPPPSAPTLSGSGGVGGTVTLSWSVPASGAAVTGYQLQAGSAPGASNVAVVNFASSQTALVTSGVPSGTYYVRVLATSASGPGTVSNELVLVVP